MRISVRIPDEQYRRIVRIAERKHSTVSDVIRSLINSGTDETDIENITMKINSTTVEILANIKDIKNTVDYFMDKDKRREYQEARL